MGIHFFSCHLSKVARIIMCQSCAFRSPLAYFITQVELLYKMHILYSVAIQRFMHWILRLKIRSRNIASPTFMESVSFMIIISITNAIFHNLRCNTVHRYRVRLFKAIVLCTWLYPFHIYLSIICHFYLSILID